MAHMRFLRSNITSSCTYGIREKKKWRKKKEEKVPGWRNRSVVWNLTAVGIFCLLRFCWFFFCTRCFVWMKWLGNAALSNAIFTAAQFSETMSIANWTEQLLNTLRLILQDSFPPCVNYAQREYSANHKPGKACENMSGPLSNCNC